MYGKKIRKADLENQNKQVIDLNDITMTKESRMMEAYKRILKAIQEKFRNKQEHDQNKSV